jgi:AAA+ superfamily predicted ATPase
MSKQGRRRNVFKALDRLEALSGFEVTDDSPREQLNQKEVQDWSDECIEFFEEIRFSGFLITQPRQYELFVRLNKLASMLGRVANYHHGLSDDRHRNLDKVLAEVHWHLLGPNCDIDLADHYFRRSGRNPEISGVSFFDETPFVNDMIVAERLFDGVGVERDTERARMLYKAAAKLHHSKGDIADEALRLIARLDCEANGKFEEAIGFLHSLWTYGGYIAAQGSLTLLSELYDQEQVESNDVPHPVTKIDGIKEDVDVPEQPPKTIKNDKKPEASKEQQLREALDELNAMIGLGSVKAKVTRMVSQEKVRALRRAQGLGKSSTSPARHMVLTGNPGTGKTTIARVMAKLFFLMGILENDVCIETDRQGLVGGYLGQTAIKTAEVIESALGGVLFIDEAYALQAEQDIFGEEAINTLLKAMEDHRSELIVVVAGYTEEMEAFLESNPGLRSRFNTTLNFEDYSPSEMLEILVEIARKNDFSLDSQTSSLAASAFQHAQGTRLAESNGRFVRNFYEAMEEQHAERVANLSASILKNDRETLRTFVPSDLVKAAAELGLDVQSIQLTTSSAGSSNDDAFRILCPIPLTRYTMEKFT